MEDIFKVLVSIEFIISYKLILSVLIGGLIGFDRGKNGRQAGVKTHGLVCLGSCLVMCIDTLISIGLGSDSTRLAAAVISGVGFLGAGVILVDQNETKVYGLTTAAGIWVSACLGLAIGSNYTWLFIPAVLCFFLVTHGFTWLERKYKE